jgi:hypothetical protein
MSSPRIAGARSSRRPKPTAAKPTAQRPASVAPIDPGACGLLKPGADSGVFSVEAERLARNIEQALAGGRRDILTPQALQALMAAVCRTYAAQVEAGGALLPLPQRGCASATEVMITASGLLKAANLAVFELGMWQSFTGR